MLGSDGQQPAGHRNNKYCGKTKKKKNCKKSPTKHSEEKIILLNFVN